MPGPSEADARIRIDALLAEAGWDLTDKTQVITEVTHDLPLAQDVTDLTDPALLTDTPSDSRGRADYVLLGSRGRPLAVVEAKRTALDPYVAKQQVLPYAQALSAPFIFLSNGDVIYFWDWRNDDARVVSSFFSRSDLERLDYLKKDEQPLATVPIPEHYLRAGESRMVRPYQREAMRAMDHALETRKRRFLLELPTGTGKTDVVALYLKRLFEANRCRRILFLADREELAKQALSALQDLLPAHSSYWLRAGMAPQLGVEITVCLLQTMIGRCRDFTAGYFDVVVADECHRSIYGQWQTALTRFDAFHIGLTATPARYIDRNTYRFYHCRNNRPDFSFSITEAVENNFLSPWRFAEGITKLIAQGADIDGEQYDPAAFERKWTNEDTNRKMMREFDDLAHRDFRTLAPKLKDADAPGKSIVFALTKHHAARLCRYLNDLHPEAKGEYAAVITSDVADADVLIRKFKRERFPKVAVSVDMLTTGFDCREVLHLVLCRPIHSRILYEQIRGRGTRTAPHIGKERFVIYDFFGNRERFDDYNIEDEEKKKGPGGGEGGGETPEPPEPTELVELGVEDEWLHRVTYVEVGPEGERIDKRAYVSAWEETVRKRAEDDALLARLRQGQALTSEEEDHLAHRLNSPRHYFNAENLSRAYDHEGTIIDFVREALGLVEVRTREEIMEDNFRAWLVTKDFTPNQAAYLVLLKNRGAVRGGVSMDDLFEPPLALLGAAQRGMELFGKDGLQEIIAEMNDVVFPRRARQG